MPLDLSSDPETNEATEATEATEAIEGGSVLGAPAWTYSVSVCSLCEFTPKRGDLDWRFTPSAIALEGISGPQTVTVRRGPDHETEIALERQCGPLRVRGRADGYDWCRSAGSTSPHTPIRADALGRRRSYEHRRRLGVESRLADPTTFSTQPATR